MRNWFKNETETPPWAKILGVNPRRAGAVIMVGMVLYVGWQIARPYYDAWQLRQTLSRSQQFFAKQDIRSAVLTARQVLRINPNNLPATRIMAESADKAGSPSVVLWRNRVADLDPGRNSNYLAWAESALRRSEWVAAEQALARVDAEGQKSREFLLGAATLAMGQRQYQAAESYLGELVLIDPTNLVSQLNLANVRLRSNNPKVVQEAVATLERLKTKPELRLTALRSLAADALRGNDNERKLEKTAELLATPGIWLNDRVLRLDALEAANRSEVNDTLALLVTEAGDDVNGLYTLLAWMNAHGRAMQALSTILTRPAEIRMEQPIPIAMAESYSTLKDWNGLRALTSTGNWHEMEFVRLAIHARALREQGLLLESRDQWRRAIAKTQDSGVALGMLVRLAVAWNWGLEAEEIWWRLADHHLSERQALLELYHIYSLAGNTRSLYRVSVRIYQLDPQNIVAVNNVAALALLLKSDLRQGIQLALENYNRSPNNPIFVSTQAYSLYVQNRIKAAAELMDRLPEEYRAAPELAAYYGVILAANHENAKAQKYLNLSAPARLLPEEVELVKAARASLSKP